MPSGIWRDCRVHLSLPIRTICLPPQFLRSWPSGLMSLIFLLAAWDQLRKWMAEVGAKSSHVQLEYPKPKNRCPIMRSPTIFLDAFVQFRHLSGLASIRSKCRLYGRY